MDGLRPAGRRGSDQGHGCAETAGKPHDITTRILRDAHFTLPNASHLKASDHKPAKVAVSLILGRTDEAFALRGESNPRASLSVKSWRARLF